MIYMEGGTKQEFEDLLVTAIEIKEQSKQLTERKKALAEQLGTKAGTINAILALALRERDKPGKAISETRNVADSAEVLAAE